MGQVNARTHRTTRSVVVERLEQERALMRPLPAQLPETDRRLVIRVPQQPYLRFDTCDFSLHPRLAGRRVEVRISQSELVAVSLDSGELACRHRRRFAKHLTFTDPEHQRALDDLRGGRRRPKDVDLHSRRNRTFNGPVATVSSLGFRTSGS